MNVSIKSNGYELSPFATNLLQRKIGSVLNRLGRLGDHSPIDFHVSGQGGEVLVKANVTVDGHQLVASKTSRFEVEAVKGCIYALLRQLDKIRLLKLPVLRKKARNRMSMREASVDVKKKYLAKIPSQIIRDLYPSLRRIATEKVALYQATTGIETGYLDPDEVVDDVLVEMIGSLDPDSSAIELKRRFLQATEAVLKARIEEYESEAKTVVSTDGELLSVDEKVELSSLGDEVLDFWVLDEQLYLEDVIEAPELRSPEDIVSDKEARHVLMNALLRLPAQSRYVFTSYIMDENSIEDVSAYVGEEVIATEQILRSAIGQLRTLLTESDSMVSGESVIALYRRMSELFHVDPAGLSSYGKLAKRMPAVASSQIASANQ